MDMDALHELTVIAGIRRHLDEREKEVRSRLTNSISGDKMNIPLAFRGEPCGEAIYHRGATSVKVVDEDLFAAWAAATHPAQVCVRATDRLVKAVRRDSRDRGTAWDNTSRQEVPGVQLSRGRSYVTVNLDEPSKERFAEIGGTIVSALTT